MNYPYDVSTEIFDNQIFQHYKNLFKQIVTEHGLGKDQGRLINYLVMIKIQNYLNSNETLKYRSGIVNGYLKVLESHFFDAADFERKYLQAKLDGPQKLENIFK